MASKTCASIRFGAAPCHAMRPAFIATTWSQYLAPGYAVLEGLFVGSISAMYNYSYPGLPTQAVALTLLVTLIMYMLYRYRIIKVTKKLRMVVVVATAAIAIFYMVQWITFLVMGSPIGSFTNAATPLGIGFSILVVTIVWLYLELLRLLSKLQRN